MTSVESIKRGRSTNKGLRVKAQHHVSHCGVLLEAKRCRVNTVTDLRGFWAVIEDMAKMGITLTARDFDAL
jgi:hypothetical protein